MNILVLGANGQVGFELVRALRPLGEVISATRTGLSPSGAVCGLADLADPRTLVDLFAKVRPDVVVNAAAYTAVDLAEDQVELADQINHQAVRVMAQWAKESNACVVHYSTDYVFDGLRAQPYCESDSTAPCGVYGASKRAGECALLESGCEHIILRTAWVYAARGKNFLRTILRLASERDQLKIVGDQRGAPTSSRLLAVATLAVLLRKLDLDAIQRRQLDGIYHLTASGECSWFEFASAIIERAVRAGLLGRAPQLVAITTKEYPTKARRPQYSALNTAKIRDSFGLHLPSWQEGLDDVLSELAEIKKMQAGDR